MWGFVKRFSKKHKIIASIAIYFLLSLAIGLLNAGVDLVAPNNKGYITGVLEIGGFIFVFVVIFMLFIRYLGFVLVFSALPVVVIIIYFLFTPQGWFLTISAMFVLLIHYPLQTLFAVAVIIPAIVVSGKIINKIDSKVERDKKEWEQLRSKRYE